MQNNTIAGLPTHVHGRKATWFELFFDLVFVVAVAQLAATLSHHYDWRGAAQFTFGFLALWWCWLGQTFYASRFDEDRPDQRWLGLLQIVCVAWMAYGASALLDAKATAFALSLAAFKLLLAVAYWRNWHITAAQGLIRSYALLYIVQAVLWAAALALNAEWRIMVWGGAIVLDSVSPWWVARHTHTVPPHPEHLPERFGLFTIILMGEGMAATVHALNHHAHLTMPAVTAALGGTLVLFVVWWGYFETARAQRERAVLDASAGRNLRLWAYAHIPLYVGLVSLAASIVAMAATNQATSPILVLSVTAIALGLSLLAYANGPNHPKSRRKLGLQIALAASYCLVASWTGFTQLWLVFGLAAGLLWLGLH